jgi:hypothetical protein
MPKPALYVSRLHVLVILSVDPEVNALAMDNSTESISGFGIFNFGNGLVEVAALTSLIGSTAAQSLIVADKGPAGLVWATMTIFGAMSIAMLFTTAVTPGWLSDSVGVRSAKSDAVVSLSLNLSKSFKCRGCNGAPKAVECEIQILSVIDCLEMYEVLLIHSRVLVEKRSRTQ